ncbi:MAG: Fasciclin, partial [Phycisphaerales bacterium]|nr:Fasciclin [Phycisphaerales bacterium]
MFRSTRAKIITSTVSCIALGAFAIVPFATAQESTMPKQQKVPPMAGHEGGMAGMTAPKDIIDIATGPGMTEVSTVVTAIKAAGLVETLKGPGPFTVFAPTNEA